MLVEVVRVIKNYGGALTRRIVVREFRMTVRKIVELFLMARVALTVRQLRDVAIGTLVLGVAHCAFRLSRTARRLKGCIMRRCRWAIKHVAGLAGI